MAWVSLPVTSYPDTTQTFALEGVNYVLRLRYNERGGAWFVDVADDLGNVLAAGRKVVVNWPIVGARETSVNLFPGWLFAFDTSDIDLDPTEEDMGTRVQLYYLESV
jgi:hypothetical protein